jgi:uncharacterized protein (TIGR00730 family)
MSARVSICVFLGSSLGAKPIYAEAARELGRLLAIVLADAALEAGGKVIGVIPRWLAEREIAHRGVSELHLVDSMHERKARMAGLAQAFVCLPGGYGTLDEFCEVLTWGQLAIHRKPCGLLNLGGYYDPLIAQFDKAVEEGLLRPAHRALVQTHSRADGLLDLLDRLEPTAESKWDGR